MKVLSCLQNRKYFQPRSFILLLCLSFFQISNTVNATNGFQQQKQSTLNTKDQTDTLPDHKPISMPYNRLIDPVGTVVRFGDPNLENHSLDATLLPSKKQIVVEDRYGIVILDAATQKIVTRYALRSDKKYKSLMSTFSGIKAIEENGETFIFWSIAESNSPNDFVLQAKYDGKNISIVQAFPFKPLPPSLTALPNELEVLKENGELYLYVVLNGNNQVSRIRVRDQQLIWTANTGVAPYGITIVNNSLYVTNWGGPTPTDTLNRETAGVPWGSTYIDPKTGATKFGTVSVFNKTTGEKTNEISVGLHPNAIIHSTDNRFIYVANGNSDYISVINVNTSMVIDTIPVSLYNIKKYYEGSTPNALAIDPSGKFLYVANGMNNALAVIETGVAANLEKLNNPHLTGFIPTEAYPSGIILLDKNIFVTNLEATGARVNSNTILKGLSASKKSDIPITEEGAYNSHKQLASVSFIPMPNQKQLDLYTEKVKKLNMVYLNILSRKLPRKGIAPQPIPERIGEPSLFKHVIYIIKENRTYDQVLGDMKQGNGKASLCIFGENITPNQHQLSKDFLLMDNYLTSGKCSAEGHQWTDAAMVNDYVEKNVRAWFRSYPHVQQDAMVYDKEGFIWNNALDHGKTVRIYGETCVPKIDSSYSWTTVYQRTINNQPIKVENITTISRVRPILSPDYPGFDNPKINDQLRARAFINELNEFEQKPGDQLPQLMILALPSDHTVGTNPGYPTPNAMVADNDLALGKIVEAVNKSRFWDSTVIFVTEDDSQSGWDHVSAYRTTCFVISPYSRLQKTISANYNQTSMVRTIEQILGIPPMNSFDATATPMFECFSKKPDLTFRYTTLPNRTPLDELNTPLTALKGKALYYARLSSKPEFEGIDSGDDDLFNRILWFNAKGNARYPAKESGKDEDNDKKSPLYKGNHK